MKIAVPLVDNVLCMHFGHAEQFAFVDVDVDARTVGPIDTLTPPPHEPGVLPAWLAEQGAGIIIAGGMGQRAQQLFAEHGIDVVAGASAGAPDELARAYLDGDLETGPNACEH